MRITQAVFGVFWHFELGHQLHRRGHLSKLYSTWPWARLKREGLPRELVKTFPLIHTTDYLLKDRALYPTALSEWVSRWNAVAFDAWTSRQIEPCDAFIAISGAGLATGRLVQSRGGKFFCDRGSTHQRYQDEVMVEEHRRWAVPHRNPSAHILAREEEIYATADAITVPSRIARQSFIQNGVPPEKVHVLPYGVRLDRFSPGAPPPADTFEVLFAGQISLRKGIPYLLQAFAALRHPRKHLTLVGAMQEDVRRILGRFPLENVTFAGALPQHELARRMSASHVLVLPSVEDGFGLVMAQAMACGCPVIASSATGAEHLFEDGEAGFLVPPRDVPALTARMQALADDPALRERFSHAALAAVQELGGWDHYGDLWDQLLHSITGIPRDPVEAQPAR